MSDGFDWHELGDKANLFGFSQRQQSLQLQKKAAQKQEELLRLQQEALKRHSVKRQDPSKKELANLEALSKQEQAKLDAIQAELRALRTEQDQRQKLPQCPVCGGRLEGQFRKCMHCVAELVWVEGFPCEPADEQRVRDKLSAEREREKIPDWLVALRESQSKRYGLDENGFAKEKHCHGRVCVLLDARTVSAPTAG